MRKNTSPKCNFWGAVSPLILEIELRWLPSFCLRIVSPTRWWNKIWPISYHFQNGVFFLEKNTSPAWIFSTLGACGPQPICLAGLFDGALHSPRQWLSFKPKNEYLVFPIWPSYSRKIDFKSLKKIVWKKYKSEMSFLGGCISLNIEDRA